MQTENSPAQVQEAAKQATLAKLQQMIKSDIKNIAKDYAKSIEDKKSETRL